MGFNSGFKGLKMLRGHVLINSSNSSAALDRPLGLRELEASRISRHSALEGYPYAPAVFTLTRYPWYSFLL